MNELSPKVKHHLQWIGFLCHARSCRREACLPYVDISVRIWWHTCLLRLAEAVAR